MDLPSLQGLVRAFGIELLLEGIEFGLLLQQIDASWSGPFFLQRQRSWRPFCSG
jgi:hypothetical protein